MTESRHPRVLCIVVECDLEAVALRAFLDCATGMTINVTLRGVATSYQLTDALCAAADEADLVVITCHGDDEGIILEELAPGVLGPDQPFEARVGPEQIRARVRLHGQTVVATGCSLGTAEMARAFLGAGAGYYVAAAGDPEGWAGPLLLALLCHELLVRGRALPEALKRIAAYDAELALFRGWGRDAAGAVVGLPEGG